MASNIDLVLEKLEGDSIDEGTLFMLDDKIKQVWLNFLNGRTSLLNQLLKYFGNQMVDLDNKEEIAGFLKDHEETIRKKLGFKFGMVK